MLTTTLNDIRVKSPCHEGWTKLLKHLGKTQADDEPLPILTVLESNGLDDALWVLDKCIGGYICRLVGADFAERVLHIFEGECPDDNRPRRAIEVARDPDANDPDLAAAGAAARGAERAAVGWAEWAAAAAAWAAAAAAWAAAGDARDATWAASGAAAGDAQFERLRQYLTHGEAAKDMPWPEQGAAQ